MEYYVPIVSSLDGRKEFDIFFIGMMLAMEKLMGVEYIVRNEEEKLNTKNVTRSGNKPSTLVKHVLRFKKQNQIL